MRTINIAIFLLLAFSGREAQPELDAPPAKRPNILFVFADQWRAQAFGFAGDPNVLTPHLDALQRESIDCVIAISSVSVCGPARASLLTGQRVLTHGVFLNDVPLNPAAVTIAKVLDKSAMHRVDTPFASLP